MLPDQFRAGELASHLELLARCRVKRYCIDAACVVLELRRCCPELESPGVALPTKVDESSRLMYS